MYPKYLRSFLKESTACLFQQSLVILQWWRVPIKTLAYFFLHLKWAWVYNKYYGSSNGCFILHLEWSVGLIFQTLLLPLTYMCSISQTISIFSGDNLFTSLGYVMQNLKTKHNNHILISVLKFGFVLFVSTKFSQISC